MTTLGANQTTDSKRASLMINSFNKNIEDKANQKMTVSELVVSHRCCFQIVSLYMLLIGRNKNPVLGIQDRRVVKC